MSTTATTEQSTARIPTEFRYWDKISSRSAQALRRSMQLLFGSDPQLSDAQVRAFGESYFDADPVGEAVVEEVYLPRGQSEGRALVDRALRNGVGSIANAPASLQRLFQEIEEPPRWFDEKFAALGAKVFRRWGTHLYSFAGAITLEGYREASVAKPLAFTGAYAGESAQRRFLETASFWIDVSSPHALAPGGVGRATALRVRLMHVFVRQRLLRHPKWDLAAWGVPISQADASLTLMGGSVAPAYGLRLLGYRTAHEEIEALLHFWRWVGHLMGVQPKFYPQNVAEGLGLLFTSQVKGARTAGDDAIHLARSYVDSYAPRAEDSSIEAWMKRFEHGLQKGYVRWFVPANTHKHYGLPSAGLWALHPLLQAPFIFLRETARRKSSTVDAWLDERVQQETRRWVARRLGNRRAEYRATEHFTR